MDYSIERAMKVLDQYIDPNDTEIWQEFSIFKGRLAENLRKERLFGSTETLRSERSEIIYALNPLAQRLTGVSFNDLAVGKSPAALPSMPQVAGGSSVALAAPGTLSKPHADVLERILARLAANSSSDSQRYFQDRVNRTDLPPAWKMEVARVWSGNTRGDARQLIRWAEAKGVNPRDKRYTVIGSLLTVLLADNLGLEDAATIATIIASDRLYADTQLLDDLIVRFQIPQSITNEDGITGVSRTTGPTIRWRGTTDEEELQSFLKEPPDLIDIAFLSQAILRSRSVCKIEIPSIGRTGTGFLITNNLVLTNYHVLKDSIDEDLEANAQNLVLHFGYYTGEGSTQLFALDAHDPVVAQSSVDQLDFALLRVNQAILTAHDLGPAVPSRALPSKGSGLHILQHPQGGTMKLGLSSNGVTGVYEDRGLIQYVTRASNGSSGAPCFNDKWEVVAIHHAERSQAFGSIREGILFQFVYSQIHSYL